MLSNEQIEKLKAEHGDLWRIDEVSIDGEPCEIVVKRPKKGELARFMKAVGDDDKRMGAARALCSTIVVYPESAKWDAMCDDCELLPITVAGSVAQRAAGDAKTTARKL